ncbi:hypothetical protein Salat_1444400 [Sesamum alatum]|uniref:Uncharacterized protein n=1 Tax=Sesamum alatum TaxID=300844 RepID=A0AAE1YAY1_9LAMI|nr:hypothetical protein Salat_1444400 [Sesamum alatum]
MLEQCFGDPSFTVVATPPDPQDTSPPRTPLQIFASRPSADLTSELAPIRFFPRIRYIRQVPEVDCLPPPQICRRIHALLCKRGFSLPNFQIRRRLNHSIVAADLLRSSSEGLLAKSPFGLRFGEQAIRLGDMMEQWIQWVGAASCLGQRVVFWAAKLTLGLEDKANFEGPTMIRVQAMMG